ncbi:M48 family metalloprotease [Methylicorpusculum sp.]|uniref:M48 family metalloprotease n=1 Tax=Methylicorpusculum sp. TaxID=2713644 RepID=UPI002ABA7F84|nr:M48 family metalloprotease [Methylicorpusculum sp.]MDZ4153959.1 M48 family metalloprotease [Methylicorpusculum sp.]
MNRLSRACLIWCCIVFGSCAHDAKNTPESALLSPATPLKTPETDPIHHNNCALAHPLPTSTQAPHDTQNKSSQEVPPWLSTHLTLETPCPRAQHLFEQIAPKLGLKIENLIFKQSSDLLQKYRYHAISQGNILIFDTSQAALPLDEFTFLLAHELAHIKHHDTNKQIAAHLLSALVKITLAGIAFEKIGSSKNSLTKICITAGCLLFSHWLSKRVINQYVHYQEKHADLAAINALGTKRGAIAWLTRGAETNKKIDATLLKDGIRNRDSLIDSAGNNLDDTTHPALTERIAYINAAMPNE